MLTSRVPVCGVWIAGLCAIAGGEPPGYSGPEAVADPTPAIDVWYGDHQVFGRMGDPQPLVNILGSVTHPREIGDAFYRVNDGERQQIVFGCDLHRLARSGDFNLEIDRARLHEGANLVEIRVRTLLGYEVTRSVTVEYETGNRWPLPYSVDWKRVTEIRDVAEVIDGKWTLTGHGVRTAEPYYDRVLAFGDASWKDYEVVVDVIYHEVFGDHEGRNAKGPPYLDHAHASLALRWGGHPADGRIPRREWRNAGGLVMLRADLATGSQASRWWLHFARPDREPGPVEIWGRTKTEIEPEVRYRYRARVETISEMRSKYSMKVWVAGEPEPVGWDLEGVDVAENVGAGSILLIAHHSDVTFGQLEVTPLP